MAFDWERPENFLLRTAPAQRTPSGSRLLVAEGRLTAVGAELLLDAVDIASGDPGVREISVDLTAVTVVEPVAAAELLAARDLVEANGCVLDVISPTGAALPDPLVAAALALLTDLGHR